MTAASLRSLTAKDLAKMARERGVAGWHSMRKEDLIRAIVVAAGRRSGSRNGNGAHRVDANGSRLGKSAASAAKTNHTLHQLHDKLARIRNLATPVAATLEAGARSDRLVVMVRDPYWLHAYWELSPRSVERARAALGQQWHGAKPVLRLFRVRSDDATVLERDIAIHGGVRNWYIDVQNPPGKYRLEIGYLSEDGSFYRLARSNEVATPRAGTSDAVDQNWTNVAENADRIFAMSGGYSAQGASRELQELLEERLRRPLGTPMQTRYGSGAAAHREGERLEFAVDAEIIVYGATSRNAHVTLQGEPVQLRDDGTFAVRLSLPDRRQVIPIVASSHDGVEQRTTILAVERNTKELEPVVRDVAEQHH